MGLGIAPAAHWHNDPNYPDGVANANPYSLYKWNKPFVERRGVWHAVVSNHRPFQFYTLLFAVLVFVGTSIVLGPSLQCHAQVLMHPILSLNRPRIGLHTSGYFELVLVIHVATLY